MDTAGKAWSGLDLSWRQHDVRPQDDLFRHVNGRWLDTVPIPQERASCGTVLDVKDATQARLREIVERAARSAAETRALDRDERRIGDLYASFLDEELAERAGITPLQADLDEIAAVDDVTSLARALGRLQRTGISGPVKVAVSADAGRYLVHLSQGGLGLPDESYYRLASRAAIRASYRAHLRRMLTSAGIAGPERAAERVIELETRIASWHADRVRARSATAGRIERLGELAPGFDWDAWLDGLGAATRVLDEVVVRQPGFLRELSRDLARAGRDWQGWRDWLSWRVIRSMSPLLAPAFCDESFAFYQTELTGATRQPERWKRGLRVVEAAFGDALGRLYVAEHFPPRSRELADDLAGRLTDACRRGIARQQWLSRRTRTRALDKLAAFRIKTGHPDQWTDYGEVVIRRDDLVGNVRRAQEARLARQLARIGTRVSRDEWAVTPQTVNAYYDAGTNQVFVPAAMLQPPFFSPAANPAVNYGAIGAIIGHEIAHAFDDHGAKYDGAGNLRDWWTEPDRAAFEERAAALVAQYSALAVAPGQHVNGALTVSENIGDLAGLAIAYRAYQAEKPDRDGARRFFLSWARLWRGKVRDAELARRLAVDPHAPRQVRCNAVVRNLDEFHDVFGVRPGDGLWLEPAARVRIW